MAKRLPKAARAKIEQAIEDLFDKAKLRLLGPKAVDKKLYVSYNRERSLPGLYEEAAVQSRGIPDHDHLDQLMTTASNYLDAVKLKAKSRTIMSVQNFMQDVAKHRKRGDPAPDINEVLATELYDMYGEIKHDVRRIIDTEAQHTRNVGVMDGITRANNAIGVSDPVVFFVVVRDEHLCKECKTLHLLKDEKTPRVWRMSELGHGYHERGEDHPKVGGLHPHCRCSMTTLLPGFGFNDAGMVAWKKEGHDELERQRGL